MGTENQIIKLMDEYYSTDIIIKDVVILEEKGQKRVNVFDNLAAIKWKIYKTDKITPDIDKTYEITERRKTEKAQQLFSIALGVLKRTDKLRKWNSEYGREPKMEDEHTKLMDYSRGAFYFLNIITPYEYEVQEQLLDEQGILVGNKMIPKEEQDLTEGALD